MSHAQGTHVPTETRIPLRDADNAADASIGTLVKNASAQVSTLVRAEIELAKTEITEQVKKGATGIGFFAAAGVLALLSLLPFIFMWAKLISMWLGTLSWDWAGFLIVFVVLLLLAGVFALLGLKKVKSVRKPERTINSVQDLKQVVPTGTGTNPYASASGASAGRGTPRQVNLLDTPATTATTGAPVEGAHRVEGH